MTTIRQMIEELSEYNLDDNLYVCIAEDVVKIYEVDGFESPAFSYKNNPTIHITGSAIIKRD